MKKLLLVCLPIILLLVSCTSIPPEKKCTQDSDCFPATCCHAADAVNKEFAPACQGKLCTMECVPETIDCGQGEIKCVSGMCKVVLV